MLIARVEQVGFRMSDVIWDAALVYPPDAPWGSPADLLVARPDDADAVAALKQGASGYCSRQSEPTLLRRALQRVRAGEIWVGRSVTGHLLEELAALSHRRGPEAPQRLRRLTARERELVAIVAAGASNKEIAERLSIAERTVKAHLTSIFQKLGVSSRLHLAVYALEAQAPA